MAKMTITIASDSNFDGDDIAFELADDLCGNKCWNVLMIDSHGKESEYIIPEDGVASGHCLIQVIKKRPCGSPLIQREDRTVVCGDLGYACSRECLEAGRDG